MARRSSALLAAASTGRSDAASAASAHARTPLRRSTKATLTKEITGSPFWFTPVLRIDH